MSTPFLSPPPPPPPPVLHPRPQVSPSVCLFVLDPYPHLSRGVNSRGRTYGEAPLPPRSLVTPGPRCSSCSLSPHTYCHASCIRSVPSPVLLSYTDILPSIWSAPSLSSCPTHINNPHTYEPLKPTYKLCYLFSIDTRYRPTRYLRPPSPPTLTLQ